MVDDGDDEVRRLLRRAEHLEAQISRDRGALRIAERRLDEARAKQLREDMAKALSELTAIFDRIDELLDG